MYDEQFRLRQGSPELKGNWGSIHHELWSRVMSIPSHDQIAPYTHNKNQYQSNFGYQVKKKQFACNDFNAGDCKWTSCKFSHICSICNSNMHNKTQCQHLGAETTKPKPNHTQSSFRGQRGTFRGRPYWNKQ
jgi:hypothetical protein